MYRLSVLKFHHQKVVKLEYIEELFCCLKVEETTSVAEALLGDLNGFKNFRREAYDLLEELRVWRRDQFDEWSRDIQALIEDTRQPLR